MVVGATHDEQDEGKPWCVVVARIVTAAAMVGVLLGLLAQDWRPGLCAAVIIVGIPVVGVALNIIWGAMVIPPMVLLMKLLCEKGAMGMRSTNPGKSEAHDDAARGDDEETPEETDRLR